MAETPFVSADDYFDESVGDGMNQRPSLAFREMRRRLSVILPDLIDKANEQLGYSGEMQLTKPAGYKLAPTVLTDEYINHVLISISYQNEAIAPKIFKGALAVMVIYIGQEIETDEMALERFDMGALIQKAMAPYINCVRDEYDRRCWNQCIPVSITALPEQWQGYSGCVAEFRVIQHPGTGTNAWT